jgi:hypothetical protein
MMTQVYPFSEPQQEHPSFRPPSLIPDLSPRLTLSRQGGLVVEVLGLLAPDCFVVARLGSLLSDLPGGEGDELIWLF